MGVDSRTAALGLPTTGSVAALLCPEAEVVPFQPRPELGDLMAWCGAAGQAAVRLVTGEGGAGKTRLAFQFARDLDEAGWQASWVPFGREREAVGAALDTGQQTVLLVDHAETRAGLPRMLDDVAADPGGPRLRVVLLARRAGEWWQQLINGADHQLAELLAAAPLVTLGPLTRGQSGGRSSSAR